MNFINRENELRQLEEYHELSKKRLATIAISGLRRVGKTTLINEFMKNKKAVYFFVYESKTSTELLAEFTQELKNAKIVTELETLPSWHDFFRVLFERCKNRAIVFDEFQNFYAVDKTAYSIMQKNIDEHKETPMNLIVLGSLIGLFKKVFEDKKQPLYGRINAKINLKPFTLKNSAKAMQHLGCADPEKMLKTYALFGGYPKYYAAIEQFELANKNILQTIEYLFIQENAPLENEVLDILKQEFGKRSPLYYSILHAIATGKTKLNEIAAHCGSKESSITRHLLELEEKFELITSLKPLGNKKNTRYS
ncbi:ATP-binding protein, partial [Candidatus Micrarchaeota archaeon]|nr:ATP-binding protein [Candidatus Micrarchaeota archaeon]